MSDHPKHDHDPPCPGIRIDVIREQILTRTSIVPDEGDVEGGFVLTQVVDIEKAIHLKHRTCLLEKKLPIQVALICFKTKCNA